MKVDLWQGDCLELMKDIPDGSVDMILCDLPYGTTACKWDIIIPFEPLWEQYNRIIKDGGIIALFGSEPFSTELRHSNLKMFKYDWIWEKEQGANFMLCKQQPYKVHENISVFYNTSSELYDTTLMFEKLKSYMLEQKELSGLSNKEIQTLLGNYMGSHYFTTKSQFAIPTKKDYLKLQSTGFFKVNYEEIKREYDLERKKVETNINTYNPQMTKGMPYISGKGTSGDVTNNVVKVQTKNKGTRYPRSVQKFNTEKSKGSKHPTQKPVALLEYLIKTYTNENEIVLDNCMGSGSTGVACVNTNRNFIGIELDEDYFNVAQKRIEEAQEQIKPISPQ